MDLGLTDLEVHRVTSTLNMDGTNFEEDSLPVDLALEAKARSREAVRQNELQNLYLKEVELKRKRQFDGKNALQEMMHEIEKKQREKRDKNLQKNSQTSKG